MCGICGIVASADLADSEAARLRVEAMLQSLSHRGPDAVGQVTVGSGVLGATRLAIRGLEDGAQPMMDPDTGISPFAMGRSIITANFADGWQRGGAQCAVKRTWR